MSANSTFDRSQQELLVRTYTLRASTVQQLKELVAATDAYDSHLVDMLLSRALTEVAAGRWRIKRKPIKFEIELT